MVTIPTLVYLGNIGIFYWVMCVIRGPEGSTNHAYSFSTESIFRLLPFDVQQKFNGMILKKTRTLHKNPAFTYAIAYLESLLAAKTTEKSWSLTTNS